MSNRESLECAEIEALRIAKKIGGALPDGWLFGLFLFTKGEAGYMTWVSNCDRRDVIKALREWLATNPEDRLEDQT